MVLPSSSGEDSLRSGEGTRFPLKLSHTGLLTPIPTRSPSPDSTSRNIPFFARLLATNVGKSTHLRTKVTFIPSLPISSLNWAALPTCH